MRLQEIAKDVYACLQPDRGLGWSNSGFINSGGGLVVDTLDRIVALGPEVIVPGHGPLCGVEGPREMKAYLVYVREESRRHFDAGLTALEAAKRIDLGPYASWTEPERVLFSVERAYREFRGEPFDAPIDALAIFRGMHELRDHQRLH